MPDSGRHGGAPGRYKKEPPLPPEPPESGPRRAALEERKRSGRRKRTLIGTALAVVGIFLGAGLVFLLAREVTQPDAPPPPASPLAEEGPTVTLLFGTKEGSEGSKRTIWTTILSYDPEEKKGAIGYIPAHTASEIPGRGLQGLGDAYESGGVPLLLVTAENLLGIGIDRYLQISDNDAQVLFQKLGPLSVEVPDEVRVSAGPGRTRLLFDEGRQRLPASFLKQLLYTLGDDADDIDLGSRHIAFWDALLDTFSADPDSLAAAVRGAKDVLADSDAPAESHAEFFAALAALPVEDRVVRALSVTPLEVPGNRLYASDTAEIASFVEEVVGSGATDENETRVQILNGNGVPGIGQAVATKLVGEGFRVILSGNAKRLDYEKTLIVTYDASPAGQELARRAQALLGVGEVQVSTQDQGIVDLTIVVGKDFQRTP